MAQYRTDERNPKFRNNKLVTCFPGPLTHVDAQAFLAAEPEKRPQDFFSLPVEIRKEYAEEVKEIFVPAPPHIKAIQRIVGLVRDSYRYRNPDDPDFMKSLWKIVLAGAAIALPPSRGSLGPASGAVMIGPTGSGKSSTIARSCAYIRYHGRMHKEFAGRPCLWPSFPILRVSAAGRASERQLAVAIAAELDSLSEPHFEHIFKKSADHVLQLSKMLTSNLVGVVLIDDAQLWSRVDQRLREGMLNLIVGTMESSGIPFICAGTILLQDVLQRHRSQSEKLFAQGTLEIPPVKAGQEMHDMCAKMWQRQVTPLKMEMPSWFPVEVTRSTAGIRRYIAELCGPLFAQIAEDGLKTISEKYVRDFAGQELSGIAPGVEIINRAYRGQTVDRDHLKKYEEYIDSDAYRRAVLARCARIKMINERRAKREVEKQVKKRNNRK
ncbi:ATP-binding protein [Burkholderia sp. JPY481]